MAVGDIHVPFHDAKWLNQVFQLAQEWDVKRVAMVGDIVDGNAVSSYGPGDVTIQQEIDGYKKLEAGTLAYGFEEVTWTMGNHEDRYFRRQAVMPDGRITVKDFSSLDEVFKEYFVEDHLKVDVFDSAIIKVRIGAARWHFEHPATSNDQAATVARNLAAKLHENIATWHTHRRGYNHDVSGKFLAIDVGACAKFNKLNYTQRVTFGKSAMQQGALILKKDGDRVDHHILTPNSNFKRLARYYG